MKSIKIKLFKLVDIGKYKRGKIGGPSDFMETPRKNMHENKPTLKSHNISQTMAVKVMDIQSTTYLALYIHPNLLVIMIHKGAIKKCYVVEYLIEYGTSLLSWPVVITSSPFVESYISILLIWQCRNYGVYLQLLMKF